MIHLSPSLSNLTTTHHDSEIVTILAALEYTIAYCHSTLLSLAIPQWYNLVGLWLTLSKCSVHSQPLQCSACHCTFQSGAILCELKGFQSRQGVYSMLHWLQWTAVTCNTMQRIVGNKLEMSEFLLYIPAITLSKLCKYQHILDKLMYYWWEYIVNFRAFTALTKNLFLDFRSN